MSNEKINIILAAGIFATAPSLLAQQGRPQIRLDDALLANTPDGFDIHLESEGDLMVATWVDERDPVNNFDDDIFMRVSTDGGNSWAAELQVTNLALTALDADDNWLAVSGGNIFVSFDEDSLTPAGTSTVMYTTDLGATFSTIVYPGDLENPRVYAEGNNILVLMYDGGSTPNPLWADFSSTGPAGLGVNPLVQVNNIGADADFDGFDATVSNGIGHIAFYDDINVAGKDDLWYVSLDFASGIYTAPVMVNSSVIDVDTKMQVVADAGTVHFAWYADDAVPLGAASAFDDILFYRNMDFASGIFGTEMIMSSILDDVDYYQIAAEGSNVLIAFSDDSSGDDHPTAMVSNDGGATFTNNALPQFANGPLDAQWHGCAVRGEYMFFVAEDDSFNTNSVDELPTFWYSNDTGTTWYGPFLLGSSFEADEDIDTEDTAWTFTDQGLAGIWQTDGGAANPDALMFSGINFPYAEVTVGPGTITMTQVGNPVSTAGTYSRWGASTTLGTQVHPENPGLSVLLGASVLWNRTTSFPPIPVTTGTVAADGSSTIILNTGVAPGTYYIQAWTNSGSLTGGSAAGDVFEITL